MRSSLLVLLLASACSSNPLPTYATGHDPMPVSDSGATASADAAGEAPSDQPPTGHVPPLPPCSVPDGFHLTAITFRCPSATVCSDGCVAAGPTAGSIYTTGVTNCVLDGVGCVDDCDHCLP